MNQNMNDNEKQSQDQNQDQSDRDLQHFLRLAAAQLQHRLKQVEASEPYSSHVNQVRMLAELIKEQMPHDEWPSKDSRHPARTSR
jgi:hypothetical protein